MNSYTVEIRTANSAIREGEGLSILKIPSGYRGTATIHAESRVAAVRKSLLWFWDTYTGRLGPAKGVLTVSDPVGEVCYHCTFSCYDKGNRYLDGATVERVIAEARGELIRDDRVGKKNHPFGSVRRVKRRRKFWQRIAPTIYRSESGILYYRVISQGQISAEGKVLVKRTYRVFRLESRTVAHALYEIRRRKLRSEHKTRRWRKDRSLKWVAYVAGIASLTEDDRAYFANIVPRAERSGMLKTRR